MPKLPSTLRIEAQREALSGFLRVWDSHLLNDIGPSLGCTEAGVLEDLLRTHGYEEAADALIDSHAAEDEPGDFHYRGAGKTLACSWHFFTNWARS